MMYGIAAAGTGGHVFPALAVADELVRQGSGPDNIVFFGGSRMESETVPAEGYELLQFEVSGVQRRLTFQNLRVVGQVLQARRQMVDVIRSRHIEVMLAMGGYITGPAALAARQAGIPLIIHEQNAVPGLANRRAARWATEVLVAFPQAAQTLPNAVVVGNPIRRSLADPLPATDIARERYGLDAEVPVVGVLGGSQGAEALNHAAARLAEMADRYQLLQLAGPGQVARWKEESEAQERWRVLPFEREMKFFYAAVDLVVARAGALTVSELAATATPSILVPYVHGTARHQEANAAQLVRAGGAELLSQYDLALLPARIEAALAGDELAARAAAAATVARPEAATTVATRLRELARV